MKFLIAAFLFCSPVFAGLQRSNDLKSWEETGCVVDFEVQSVEIWAAENGAAWVAVIGEDEIRLFEVVTNKQNQFFRYQ